MVTFEDLAEARAKRGEKGMPEKQGQGKAWSETKEQLLVRTRVAEEANFQRQSQTLK